MFAVCLPVSSRHIIITFTPIPKCKSVLLRKFPNRSMNVMPLSENTGGIFCFIRQIVFGGPLLSLTSSFPPQKHRISLTQKRKDGQAQ